MMSHSRGGSNGDDDHASVSDESTNSVVVCKNPEDTSSFQATYNISDLTTVTTALAKTPVLLKTIEDEGNSTKKFKDSQSYRNRLASTCIEFHEEVRMKRRKQAAELINEIERSSPNTMESISPHVLGILPEPQTEVHIYALYNHVTAEDQAQIDRSSTDGFLMKLLVTWAAQTGIRIPTTPQYSHPHDHWPVHYTIAVQFIGGLFFQSFRLRAMWFLSSQDPSIQATLNDGAFVNPLLKFFQMNPHGGLELLPYQHNVLSFVELASSIAALQFHNISIRTVVLIAFDVLCLLFFKKSSPSVIAARERICTVPQAAIYTTQWFTPYQIDMMFRDGSILPMATTKKILSLCPIWAMDARIQLRQEALNFEAFFRGISRRRVDIINAYKIYPMLLPVHALLLQDTANGPRILSDLASRKDRVSDKGLVAPVQHLPQYGHFCPTLSITFCMRCIRFLYSCSFWMCLFLGLLHTGK